MSKITLNNVGDLTQTTTAQNTINSNFNTIQTAFDNPLSRDGTSPNQMTNVLDMNSNQVLNLPFPATANSPLRFADLNSFVGGGTVSNIPIGGITGASLIKNSGTNYDIGWSTSASNNSAGLNIALSGTNPVAIATITNPTFSTSVTTPIINNGGNLAVPNATDTLIGKATTDILTNKTFDTAATGNVFKINGVTITANTGTGSNVLATSPTIVTPTITTSITAPLVIGGTAAGSTLTLESTSNVSPSADNVNLVVGGAERARITFNGTNPNFLVGTTANLQTDMVAAFKGSGSGIFTIGQQPGATQYVTFFAATTPSAGNYLFEADSSGVDPVLYFNAPTASGAIKFQTNAITKVTLQPSGGIGIGTVSDPGAGGIFANVAAGIGTNTITSSFLTIAIGTTAKAQINFGSTGVAPTSPNNGDFWFDGTNFKARVGGATKTFTIT